MCRFARLRRREHFDLARTLTTGNISDRITHVESVLFQMVRKAFANKRGATVINQATEVGVHTGMPRPGKTKIG